MDKIKSKWIVTELNTPHEFLLIKLAKNQLKFRFSFFMSILTVTLFFRVIKYFKIKRIIRKTVKSACLWGVIKISILTFKNWIFKIVLI